MSHWWVHHEKEGELQETWHGPFDDPESAEERARWLSDPSTQQPGRFAEVVEGERGQIGKRIAEFYRGLEYAPGESGWHRRPQAKQVRIPDSAGAVPGQP